jgi:hypothetical protein
MKQNKIIIIILFFILIVSCQPAGNVMFNSKIDGVVIEKFIDNNNHYYKKIRIAQFDGTEEYLISSEFTDSWDFIEVNDTLKKMPKHLL